MTAPLPRPPQTYDQSALQEILTIIEQRLQELEQPNTGRYTVTNLTETRDIDGASSTTATVRAVLATLIQELRDQNTIS